MIPRLKPPSCSMLLCFFFVILLSCSKTYAQKAITDPSEVRALNSIFLKWQTHAANSWNISGEPCSGDALSQNDAIFESSINNPAIRCDCTFNSSTVCHITRLRVYAQDDRGVIPKELLGLPYLELLNIEKNFFSGPLPAFIGNMSRLESLSVAYNQFSGPIPKEIGNLKNLHWLSMGVNNFSGTLPLELGNLVNLQYLYIDSSGLSGEIPETFANLTNLEVVGASDVALSGKIPDFIGSKWTNLTSLRFEGNSFEGPIPSSFANLTSLTSLRIIGIYNSSSSLDFVRNLKNLTDLVLRNVLLTGVFPSYITELQSLQKLDLSFNKITGQIPSALFNMSSLKYLFLGNNSLSGNIPSQKSETLETIDLSYNLLSGNLPSWINSGIHVNLVANNFTSNSSNIRLLPGLECLQRSFPCNRNSPKYANLSIKCGGSQIRSDGILFEADNTPLGPATFNVTNTQQWAVSNTGLFAERQNQKFVENTPVQVLSTDTPELYQISRLSPGSLRYYGLGLENGPYTIHLFFAETAFPPRSRQTWMSLGRRVFDVYIQGTLRLRDFDISKAAGGAYIAVTKIFTVNVTESHLEIHMFWDGKGTCCVPEQGYYGPSISAINVVSNFKPTVNGISSGNPKDENKTALIVGIATPLAVVALILIFAIIYVRRRKEDDDQEVLLAIGPRGNIFSYSELKAATEDFSPSNKLGQGGFGPVFKGTLSDGRVVAVKQLSVASNQGKDQFVAEIATMSTVQHRNLVKLYGCCSEGKRRLLVYEYLENKSLDQALFGKKDLLLDWPTRFNICLSTARGLAYLHEESRLRIVHRDVKASNILLDAKLCPKISDFGLAKLYNDMESHISTQVAGTIGYLAPEYAMRGHLTEKADVFAFGVVALEILSGRRNSDNTLESDRIYLLEWAWTLHENNQGLGVVDPTLEEFDENEALRVLGVALLCTQASPKMRPPMSRVVAMLARDIEVSTVTSKPNYLTDWNFKDTTSTVTFMNEDTQASIASDSSDIENTKGKAVDPGTAPMLSPVNVDEFCDIIEEGR